MWEGWGGGIFLEVAMVDHGHHVRACTRTESADPMLLLHCYIIRSSWMRYSCVNSTHKPSTLNLTVMVVNFHKGALNIKNSHWLNFIQCHTISFRLTDCFINLLALYYSHWLHMFVRTVHTAVGCSNWMNLITVQESRSRLLVQAHRLGGTGSRVHQGQIRCQGAHCKIATQRRLIVEGGWGHQ